MVVQHGRVGELKSVDEVRIEGWKKLFSNVADVGAKRENTSIAPNCEVINATPTDLGSSYILVRNEDGFYIPAVKVPGLTYTAGDYVNLLYIKGTEPIAFQHGTDSSGSNGGVSGPISSTDNAIARWNGISGNAIQDSSVTIDDNNRLVLPDSATYPPLNVTERGTAPSSPATGDIYLDDGTNTISGAPGLRRYDGAVFEDIGSGGGGYPFDVLSVDFVDADADYATVTAAEAAASSGNTIEVGPGSNDEATLTVNIVVKIIGKGVDVTTLTADGSDYQAISIVAGATIEQLTASSTGSFVSTCTGVEINSASSVTLRNVRGTAVKASTTATGILCAGAATHYLYDCRGEGSSGSTNRGLTVNSGCTVVVERGYYSGSTNGIYNNGGTLVLRGPVVSGGVSGAWSGHYYDTNGDLHIDGDEAGLKERTIDIYQAPITDHFDDDTFSGLSWASGYLSYATPDNIDLSTHPSVLLLYSTPVKESFAYNSLANEIKARCQSLFETKAGIAVDDGTANNYYQLYLEYNSTTKLQDIKIKYAVGGSTTGPTTIVSGLPAGMFYVLRLQKSGSNILPYYTAQGPRFNYLQNFAAIGASVTRGGLYMANTTTSGGADRAGVWDWYKLT